VAISARPPCDPTVDTDTDGIVHVRPLQTRDAGSPILAGWNVTVF
jgi:hypothetical protein